MLRTSIFCQRKRICTWGNTAGANFGAAGLRTPSPPSRTRTQHASPLLSHNRIPNTVHNKDEQALQRVADDEQRVSDESWRIQKRQVSSCPGESEQDKDGDSPPGSLDRVLTPGREAAVAMFTLYLSGRRELPDNQNEDYDIENQDHGNRDEETTDQGPLVEIATGRDENVRAVW